MTPDEESKFNIAVSMARLWNERAEKAEQHFAELQAERDEARHHYDSAVASWAECRTERLKTTERLAMERFKNAELKETLAELRELIAKGEWHDLIEIIDAALAPPPPVSDSP